jgi:hypothetical protein
VTVKLLSAEYEQLGELCRRARLEAGTGRDVAKSHLLRLLARLAASDPVVAEKLFELLVTEGPTRHRS